MFPLAGTDLPTSAETLSTAIGAALAEVFSLPAGRGGVTIAGGTYPALTSLNVQLDGATLRATTPPPVPRPIAGTPAASLTVQTLDVSARPIRYQQAKLDVTVTGTGLTFDLGRDTNGRPTLVLTDADDGHVLARITKPDLQAVLLAAATAAAAEQKVAIQDLHVDLTSDGPRSIAATVRVKAKKMMMTGVVVLTGRVDVDDGLVATVSNLACRGEGVIGSAAAGMIQKQIGSYDGTKVPLMAFSLGDVKLRDLKVVIKDDVQVSAAFGNKAG